jgi:hypothetical protein
MPRRAVKTMVPACGALPQQLLHSFKRSDRGVLARWFCCPKRLEMAQKALQITSKEAPIQFSVRR